MKLFKITFLTISLTFSTFGSANPGSNFNSVTGEQTIQMLNALNSVTHFGLDDVIEMSFRELEGERYGISYTRKSEGRLCGETFNYPEGANELLASGLGQCQQIAAESISPSIEVTGENLIFMLERAAEESSFQLNEIFDISYSTTSSSGEEKFVLSYEVRACTPGEVGEPTLCTGGTCGKAFLVEPDGSLSPEPAMCNVSGFVAGQ